MLLLSHARTLSTQISGRKCLPLQATNFGEEGSIKEAMTNTENNASGNGLDSVDGQVKNMNETFALVAYRALQQVALLRLPLTLQRVREQYPHLLEKDKMKKL